MAQRPKDGKKGVEKTVKKEAETAEK